MSPYQFHAERSAALRQQLVQLPVPVQHPFIHDGERPEAPARDRKRRGRRLGAGTLAGALVLGALALATTPEDKSEDASRIIEALNHPQQETDRVPAGALPVLGNAGINASDTRLLGHSATITYYGAPAAENLSPGAPAGKTICMIPVDAHGESKTIGCTLLKSFESYGLKIETPDRTEAGWLVVPAAAKTSLESVKKEGGWTQQAPNFLARNNN